jgi:hypothetical protein
MVRDFGEQEYGHLVKVVRDVVIAHRRIMFWTKEVDDDIEAITSGTELLANLCCEALSIARYRFLHQVGVFDLNANTQLRTENRGHQLVIVQQSLRSAVRIISGGILEACDFGFAFVTDEEATIPTHPNSSMQGANTTTTTTTSSVVPEIDPEEVERREARERDDIHWKQNLLAASQRSVQTAQATQRPLELIRDTLEDLFNLVKERQEQQAEEYRLKSRSGKQRRHHENDDEQDEEDEEEEEERKRSKQQKQQQQQHVVGPQKADPMMLAQLQQLIDLSETGQQQQRDVWMRQARQMDSLHDALKQANELLTKLTVIQAAPMPIPVQAPAHVAVAPVPIPNPAPVLAPVPALAPVSHRRPSVALDPVAPERLQEEDEEEKEKEEKERRHIPVVAPFHAVAAAASHPLARLPLSRRGSAGWNLDAPHLMHGVFSPLPAIPPPHLEDDRPPHAHAHVLAAHVIPIPVAIRREGEPD